MKKIFFAFWILIFAEYCALAYEISIYGNDTGIAGETFQLKITVNGTGEFFDNTGNTDSETFVSGRKKNDILHGNMLLKTTGEDNALSIKQISKTSFVNGTAVIELKYFKTGTIKILVIDLATGVIGRSNDITFLPAINHGINMDPVNTANELIKAGDSVTSVFYFSDIYGNGISYRELLKHISGIKIKNADSSAFQIDNMIFNEDTCLINLTFLKTGIHKIVYASDDELIAETAEYEIFSSEPESVVLLSPDYVTAGETFIVLVYNQDRFGNKTETVSNFFISVTDSAGNSIIISENSDSEFNTALNLKLSGTYNINFSAELETDSRILTGSDSIKVIPAEFAMIKLSGLKIADTENCIIKPDIDFTDTYGNKIENADSGIILVLNADTYLIEKNAYIVFEDTVVSSVYAGVSENIGHLINRIIFLQSDKLEFRIIVNCSRKPEYLISVNYDRNRITLDFDRYTLMQKKKFFKQNSIIKNVEYSLNKTDIFLDEKYIVESFETETENNIFICSFKLKDNSMNKMLENSKLKYMIINNNLDIKKIDRIYELDFEEIKKNFMKN